MADGVLIPVSLDTSNIESDVGQIKKKISAADVANGVAKGFGKMTKAAAAGMKKFADLAAATAQSSDRIDKMSQKIGISAQSFQEWDYVMNLCGGSIEGMQMGMKTLRNVVTEAASGNKTYAATLGDLKEATGLVIDSNASEEEIMNQVIGALQGMDDQTMKAQLATELFGRSATELLPLLNTTAEETESMKQEAHDLGLVLSDDAVKAGAEFNDALTKAQSALQKAGQSIISETLPSLTELAEAFASCASGADDGAERLEAAVSNALTNVVDVLAERAPDILSMGVNILTTLLKGLSSALPKIAKAASDIIPTLCDALIELGPSLIEAGINVIVELVKGIVTNLPAIAEAAVRIGITLIKELAKLGAQLLEAGKNIVDGIVNGIKENFSKPIEAIKELGNSIVSGFKKVLGIHSPSRVFMTLGEYIDQGLANGIESENNVVISAAEAMAQGIEGVFVDFDEEGNQIGTALATGIVDGLQESDIQTTLQKGIIGMTSCFEDLGEAMASGENGWSAFAKSGLNAIASLLESLGALLATKAIAAWGNPAAVAKYVAGSAAAYLGAGLVRGYANTFAQGGIITGSSTVGDRVPVFANAGELILNAAQQKTLAAQLTAGNGGGGATIQITFAGQVFGDQATISRYVYDGIRAAQATGELE